MEHTPKNILIRAVKRSRKEDLKEIARRQQIEESIRKCEAELRVSPALGNLLDGYVPTLANQDKVNLKTNNWEKLNKEGV